MKRLTAWENIWTDLKFLDFDDVWDAPDQRSHTKSTDKIHRRVTCLFSYVGILIAIADSQAKVERGCGLEPSNSN